MLHLPADGLQQRPDNVSLVSVGGEAHDDPPGIPSPMGG